jgi:anaerobic ribonucleoside-triphosphate reductase
MLTDGTKNVKFDNGELHHTKGKNIVYYTCSKKLADDVQKLICLLGYNSYIRIRHPKNKTYFYDQLINAQTQYEVFLFKNKTCCHQSKFKKKKIDYIGNIYCVEVPNHIIMVRRNNKTSWCGNSHRVVTLNLPHIAYKSEDDEAFFKELDKNVRDAHIILDAHYDILTDNINRGKLPLYTHKFMFLQKQFSTIGFIGINEACELQKYDIMSDQGIEFATKTLNFIAKIGEQLTTQDGRIRNMEQIPGESAAVSLAQKDKVIFHNHKYDMYANQYIPLWKTVDIQDRIRISGKLDGLCSGGGICHLNSSDSLTQNQMKMLINTAAKSGCIYYAVNMAFARCNTCQKLYIGKFEKSPCHNADMTHYMRVVGFLTPVENWIPERRVEYTKRQIYNKLDFK